MRTPLISLLLLLGCSSPATTGFEPTGVVAFVSVEQGKPRVIDLARVSRGG